MKTGILLINLGTPNSAATIDVKKYLAQFLMDARVIDIPALPRWILVRGLITPLRSKRSAKAYRKIWTEQGSPLLVHSQKLCASLRKQLADNFQIELGMRYGKPTIKSALQKLLPCEKLIILPLYPQYASSSSGTAIAAIFQELKKFSFIPRVEIINYFYDHSTYLNAMIENFKQHIGDFKADKVIFSYHGLPVRQDRAVIKESENLSEKLSYEKQCLDNTKLLAERLNLNEDQYITAFQSRLGKLPWLTPDINTVMAEYAGNGIKNIAVVCPSFICDCLETLEEIGIRAKQNWHKLSAGELKLIPALNNNLACIQSLSSILTNR